MYMFIYTHVHENSRNLDVSSIDNVVLILTEG